MERHNGMMLLAVARCAAIAASCAVTSRTVTRAAAFGIARNVARTATLAAAFAVALATALAASIVPSAAFADDIAEQNLVDPTQRADNSFIYDTTIESLFEQSSLYENRTVQVVGEVIGDRIVASGEPGYYWITVTVTDSEDKTSISVLMSEEQANQIDRYGRYGVTGTILQVRGTYHQGCNEHDGLPDIHATNSSVMSRGIDHPDAFVPSEFVPGFVAVFLGIVLMGIFYFARERTR